MDMSKFIEAKSDQWNATDLASGPRVFTIESVDIKQTQEQPVSIRLVGQDRVWRPCKTTARILVSAWGPDASKYAGRSVELYNDPTVTWSGMAVGGIRISALSHIESDIKMAVSLSKQKRSMVTVKKMAAQTDTPPTPKAPDNAADLARAAASKGKDKFTEWWNSDEGKSCRDAVKPIMAELQAAVAAADSPPQDDDECPI